MDNVSRFVDEMVQNPDVSRLKLDLYRLEGRLQSEKQHHITFEPLPSQLEGLSNNKQKEVTRLARNAAMQNLRFFKYWFDTPNEVYSTAAHYLDQIMARMIVKQRFLSCLTVSCFSLAAETHQFQINTSQLVILSQSECTVKELERMSALVRAKLVIDERTNKFCSSYDLLVSFLDVFKSSLIQYQESDLFEQIFPKMRLHLEVLIADNSTTCFKYSTLALALIKYELQQFLSQKHAVDRMFESVQMIFVLVTVMDLFSYGKDDTSEVAKCLAIVSRVLKEFKKNSKVICRQKMRRCFATTKKSLKFYSHLLSIGEI